MKGGYYEIICYQKYFNLYLYFGSSKNYFKYIRFSSSWSHSQWEVFVVFVVFWSWVVSLARTLRKWLSLVDFDRDYIHATQKLRVELN